MTLNKLNLAAEMFVEAHIRYTGATRDVDYVSSIMLAGAVVGIISPLLQEQGGRSYHSLLARLSDTFSAPGEPLTRDGLFRDIYNGLKHAGDKNRGIKASQDLTLEANLKSEAAHMLDAAKHDFAQIKVPAAVSGSLSPEFLRLLKAEGDYA